MKINLTKLIENTVRTKRYNYSEGSTDRYAISLDPTQRTAPESPYSFELTEDKKGE